MADSGYPVDIPDSLLSDENCKAALDDILATLRHHSLSPTSDNNTINWDELHRLLQHHRELANQPLGHGRNSLVYGGSKFQDGDTALQISRKAEVDSAGLRLGTEDQGENISTPQNTNAAQIASDNIPEPHADFLQNVGSRSGGTGSGVQGRVEDALSDLSIHAKLPDGNGNLYGLKRD
ncbi:hypothetical protein Dda_8287 [Drechslerella dactyloides]|uniref:Uncharacterized protein n=1 Tax=Drechslerella dactyloides TaxID=74499 RepID=A0AAD6IRY7_DREDA|nr:hypothetical protein Dda_8287 [Drechslerella dactyloides]